MNANQQFFNQAYSGLKSQDFKQSFNEDGYCAYRGQNGLKCAVGHCIPDDRYNPSFDDEHQPTGFHKRSDIQDVIDELFPGVDHELVVELQNIHDVCSEHMDFRLVALAERFGLEVIE